MQRCGDRSRLYLSLAELSLEKICSAIDEFKGELNSKANTNSR